MKHENFDKKDWSENRGENFYEYFRSTYGEKLFLHFFAVKNYNNKFKCVFNPSGVKIMRILFIEKNPAINAFCKIVFEILII